MVVTGAWVVVVDGGGGGRGRRAVGVSVMVTVCSGGGAVGWLGGVRTGLGLSSPRVSANTAAISIAAPAAARLKIRAGRLYHGSGAASA